MSKKIGFTSFASKPAKEIKAEVEYYAVSGKLKSGNDSKFTPLETSHILKHLQDSGASYPMMTEFASSAKSKKHYDTIIDMLNSINKFAEKDQKLITSLAQEFCSTYVDKRTL